MLQNLSEKAVFSFISRRLTVSVPDLAKHFGIPTSTVVGIVNRLVEKKLISAGEALPGRRGRPIITYRLRLARPVYACQIEKTEFSLAIVDQDLGVKALRTVALAPATTLDELLAEVKSQLLQTQEAAEIPDEHTLGLALAVSATQFGRSKVSSSVLPWLNDGSLARFTEFLKVPVRLVRLSLLLAEYQQFACPGPESLVRFDVGDGVSAHSMIEGQMYLGTSAMAGELGHVVIEPEGPLCGCGKRGCLEAYCSGPAIYRKVLDDLSYGVVSTLEPGRLSNMKVRDAIEQVWQAYKTGDNYSRACMEQVLDLLARSLGLVVNLLDPEVVTLGGYVLKQHGDWVESLRQRAQRWILNAADRKTKYMASRASLEDELRYVGSSYFYEHDSYNVL
jgi:glucokinase